MAVVNLTLTNVFYLISFLSPLLIVFFMILSSLLSGYPMKGVLYFTGCILISMLVILLRNIFQNQQSDNASIICNILPFPLGQTDGLVYTAPYMNIVLLIFSFFYILLSMMYNKYSVNVLLIIFLGLVCICNICVEYVNKCADLTSIITSILIGALFALLWYTAVSTINPDYTYFSEFVNNNVVCSKPRPQSFVCRQRSGNKLEDKFTQQQVDKIVNSISNSPNSINTVKISFIIKYDYTNNIISDDISDIKDSIDARLKRFLVQRLNLSDNNIIINSTTSFKPPAKKADFNYTLIITGSSSQFSNDKKLKLLDKLSTHQKFNDYFILETWEPLGKSGESVTVQNDRDGYQIE